MNKQILVIDNYDSFTYNLVQILEELNDGHVTVVRNDKFDMQEVDKYDYIVLSPGPGIPDEAGNLKAFIKRYASSKKILGVCLGLQAIGEVFGAELKNLAHVYHGVQSQFHKSYDHSVILDGIDTEFAGGRYHSWVINKDTLTDDFHITCQDDTGEIMGIEHKEYKIYAVQFHPESILTPDGRRMVENFLNVK